MPTNPTPPPGPTSSSPTSTTAPKPPTTPTTPTTPMPTTAPGPADFATLQKAVANIVSVEQSAVTLINGMAAEITKLSKQPEGASQEELSALAKQLKDSTNALAAAVTANTPAAGH